jgi:hypothetical protein
MSHHIGLQVLRAKLRGFHAAGSTISSRISKSEKERKNRLWDTKRKLGTHCRYHLVAYGLLRGVPYDRIERCAQENKLNPQIVLDVMLAHADWQQKRDLDLEKVKMLLATEAPVAAAPAPVREPSLKQTEARRLGLLKKAQLQLEKRA